MKLRNKKTGAIYSIEDIDLGNNKDGIWLGLTRYESLAELNEEWEDAPEEPEEWYINEYNEPEKVNFGSPIDDIESLREIGFLFKTKKETELAIRKCKAWKRLKEAGFEFTGWDRHPDYPGDFMVTASDEWTCDDKDLDLLFGGEG